VSSEPGQHAAPDLPHALRDREAFDQATGRRRLQVFLDYDGTLTPIVSRPEAAVLDSSMRAALRQLAARYPTAVVSGRQLDDVRRRVGLPELYYSGNHGFEIAGPAGSGIDWQFGREYVDQLDTLHRILTAQLPSIDGLIVEHKRYSLSIHYRLVADQAVPTLEHTLAATLAEHPRLRLRRGKQVFEIRPDVDWHKGKAVRRLMEAFGLEGALPIFIGDDVTDEDAFEELGDSGLGILVSDSARPTAAAFRLDDTDQVRILLGYLAER
jgi:trehalose 6-phosphate phosphatase